MGEAARRAKAAQLAGQSLIIAAAWRSWHERKQFRLGPGPAFVEAISAAFAAAMANPTAPIPGMTEPERLKAICELLGFDPANHHNAAKCPYCAEPPAPMLVCAICAGEHDNDLGSDICVRCEETAPWKGARTDG